MNFFVFSDPHHFHANNLKYSNRQFCMNDYEKSVMNSGDKEAIKNLKISKETVIRHTEMLAQFHNERVKVDDVVYSLGDYYFKNTWDSPNGSPVTWQEIRSKFNGIHIDILGNHCWRNPMPTKTYEANIYFGGLQIHLSHKPTDANPNFPINLCGHIHNSAWSEISFKEYYSHAKNVLISHPEEQDYARFIARWKDADKSKSYLINCCLDVRNMRPLNLNEVLSIYHRWAKNAK